MSLLETALQARLPLITCTTTDVVNAPKVLGHLAGYSFQPARSVGNSVTGHYIYSIGGTDVVTGAGHYLEMIRFNVEKERTLVIVNPEEEVPEAFDAREIPVPPQLVKKLLHHLRVVPANLQSVQSELHGLTLKEISEVCTLCMTKHGALSPGFVRQSRASAVGRARGVHRVDTTLGYYVEDQQVRQYVQSIGRFLTAHVDARLLPRGVLLEGAPGTGKTLASKYLAQTLDVPLLRLDLGSLMSKYVGESETNLQIALTSVETSSPCVLLIDEVEKLFSGTDDSGVTQNLLAALLWWLQERRSRVLVVMTTNDSHYLPPELTRAGRLDTTLELVGHVIDPFEFVNGLAKDLGANAEHLNLFPLKKEPYTPAALTSLVYDAVRQALTFD